VNECRKSVNELVIEIELSGRVIKRTMIDDRFIQHSTFGAPKAKFTVCCGELLRAFVFHFNRVFITYHGV